MRRILLLLLLSTPCWGQYVQISGTVVDPNGCVYQNGSGRATLVPTDVQYNFGNSPVQTPIVIVKLDSFGHFNMSLAETDLLTPQNPQPQWQLSFSSSDVVSPINTGTINFIMSPMAMTTNQDISAIIKAQAAPLPLGCGATIANPYLQIPNCNLIGTVTNGTVQLSTQTVDGVSALCATTGVAGSTAVIGICHDSCGNSGIANVAYQNFQDCTVDGSTTQNDYVTPAATTAGMCSDAGPTKPPGTVETIGIVSIVSVGVGSTSQVMLAPLSLLTPGSSGGSGVVGPCTLAGCNAFYPAPGTSVIGDNLVLDDGAGREQMLGLNLRDAFHSGWFDEVAGPALPALVNLNAFYFGVNPAFGATYGLEPFDSIPTVGNCLDIANGDDTGWRKLHDSGSPCGTGAGTSITATSPIVVTPSPITGTGVVSCPTCATGSGTEVQVNGVDTTAQTPITFNNTASVLFTNPSAGVIQATAVTSAPPQASNPSAPVLTTNGSAGSTSYTYLVVGCQDGSTCAYHSAASATTTIATGNATLTSGNSINLKTFADTLYGYRCYNVYRTASAGTPSSVGKIATCVWKQYTDTGGAGDGTTAPNTNNTQLTVTMSPTQGGCNFPMGSPVGGVDALPCTPKALDDEFTATFGSPGDVNSPQWIRDTNFGTSTVTLSGGELLFTPQGGSGTDAIRYIYQTAPSTPWTVVMVQSLFCNASTNNQLVGLGVSDGTKFISWGHKCPTSQVEVDNWSNATSFSSNSFTNSFSNFVTGAWLYFRLQDTGTNLVYSISFDGINYQQVFSAARGAFLATGPTRIGIFADVTTTATITSDSIDYVRQTQ